MSSKIFTLKYKVGNRDAWCGGCFIGGLPAMQEEQVLTEVPVLKVPAEHMVQEVSE